MTRLFEYQAESMPSWWDGNYRMDWSENNIDLMKGDGASQVVLVPTVYMDTINSTRIYRDNDTSGGWNTDGAPRTESDDAISTSVNFAKQRGLDVILKMHVNIQDETWNALIAPPEGSTPQQAEAWAKQWFASYKEVALHYARFAQAQGIKTFAIGNECESMTGPEYREYWVGIIDAIRDVYDGKLTYAATWTEALTLSFWDKLDYVGANPYISFTDLLDPTIQQLVDGWTKPSEFYHTREPIEARFGENISAIEALKRISELTGKKLIFTETGFRSINGNNYDPWVWGNGEIDLQEQADMYQAFFKIITEPANKEWIAGYWLWNYDASEYPADPSPDDGYYTHAKPADAVIKHYMGLNGVNRAPVNLTISAQAVREDTKALSRIAALKATDPDGDALSYQLLTSNVPFKIVGDQLVLTGPLDYEARASYDIVVKASDGFGESTTQAFKISVTDVDESGTPGKPPALILRGTKGRDALDGGEANDVIYGLDHNDLLRGHLGNDTLHGGAGKDTLDGGSGQDIFVFDTKLSKSSKVNKANVDRMMDFSVADDTIHVAKSVFTKMAKKGVIKSAEFYAGTKAHDRDDRIIYDKKTGALYYDADGIGSGRADPDRDPLEEPQDDLQGLLRHLKCGILKFPMAGGMYLKCVPVSFALIGRP
ncbi:hypothetical protein AB4Y85_17790 [Microvirga sp. 2YAF29]|uniref:glycoside hydrolase family 113 n=1 Tax=Microvirga sp. 2YAF29 TaxID=3233031 RepID=UPI003F9B9248